MIDNASLEEAFIKAGIVERETLDAAVEDGKSRGEESLGDTLIRLGYADQREVARAIAFHLNVPYVDLNETAIDSGAIALIPAKVARRSSVLPIRIEGETLVVAMSDPRNLSAIDDARFASGKAVRPVISAARDIDRAISRHYSAEESIDEVLRNVSQSKGVEIVTDEPMGDGDADALKKRSSMTPIVKLANAIVIKAIEAQASDVHLEPQENITVVRHRVDGMLVESMNVPQWVHAPLTSRIKIMARMDITVRRVPQDGRFKIKLDERIVDLRVSTLPTQYGEKLVMRILDSGKDTLTTGELGLLPQDLKKLLELSTLPQGMVLVCGPTGSGKTSTLYSLLTEIATRRLNIVTLEDPIEYQLAGVNQVQINTGAGLTFAKCLKSILRQDPDVIFVGEIRDAETAEIALKASSTGHLVLSSLHTNGAIAAIQRLRELECAPGLMASSLSAVIAQRLVRTSCAECQREYQPNAELLEKCASRLNGGTGAFFYEGSGCERCQQSGYKGRIGVFEVLSLTPKIRELVGQDASEDKIRRAAAEGGMTTMWEDALQKVRQGITTLEEVERVLVASAESVPEEKLCDGCERALEPDWQSCPYCGTSVTGDTSSAEVSREEEPAPPGEPRSGPEEAVASFKIVVVDDDEDIVRSVAFALLEENYMVTTASNGREALESIARDKPHLVITDVMMPELDGLALVQRIRQDVTTAFIPIIILSQKGKVKDRVRGFEVGSDDYLAKPFSVDELLMRTKAVLARAYSEPRRNHEEERKIIDVEACLGS